MKTKFWSWLRRLVDRFDPVPAKCREVMAFAEEPKTREQLEQEQRSVVDLYFAEPPPEIVSFSGMHFYYHKSKPGSAVGNWELIGKDGDIGLTPETPLFLVSLIDGLAKRLPEEYQGKARREIASASRKLGESMLTVVPLDNNESLHIRWDLRDCIFKCGCDVVRFSVRASTKGMD